MASALRITSPRAPEDSAALSSASTSRCTWSACTENCTTRKTAELEARKQSRNVLKTRLLRSETSPALARKVTCNGWAPLWGARARCGAGRLGPGIGGRPAPFRRPPHPDVRGKAS